MTGFLVQCSSLHCCHEKRIEFDALKLPDDLVFLDIPKVRRFVCEKCGGTQVSVSADWSEYYDAWQRKRQERLKR
jgi:hypothetical protein